MLLSEEISRKLRRRDGLALSPVIGALAAAESDPLRRRALVGARLQALRRKLAARAARPKTRQAPVEEAPSPAPEPEAPRPAKRKTALRGMDLQDAAALLSSGALDSDDD